MYKNGCEIVNKSSPLELSGAPILKTTYILFQKLIMWMRPSITIFASYYIIVLIIIIIKK